MTSHTESTRTLPAAWAGRVALVTGASSGIGREIARTLCVGGMRVVGCARRMDRLEQLAEELKREGETGFMPVEVDVRSEAAILSMFEHVKSTWGGVDALINNAGLGHKAPLCSGSTDAWREMLEVNVLALCICTREAVKDMLARNTEGHIIHVSSMAGHRVPSGSGVYSATKFAVRSLTEGLRQELRKLDSVIRVTAISPGYVETEFASLFHNSYSAAKQTYGRYPVLQPADIAAAVVYALGQPAHVQVHDILLRPTQQSH